nr:unnamed protein product [Spirometra erinaceieuropaei]
MVKNFHHLPYETRLTELNLFSRNYRQRGGDLIQTYRIVRGRECALDFDKFFESAGTGRLRGHPFKLQWKPAHSDVRRNAFYHRDWFDDNDATIRNLLAEKNCLHKAYVDHPTDATKTAFYRSRRQLQQRLREMQDAWTARKAEEIQGYADRNEWKNFSAIKAVYGPPTKGTSPLLSADGNTLLTEKTQILQRWAEHFRGVLNRPSVISDAAIERLPQVETNVDLDLPPSLQETIRAV